MKRLRTMTENEKARCGNQTATGQLKALVKVLGRGY